MPVPAVRRKNFGCFGLEFKSLMPRAGLTSRLEAISSFGYDAEDIDREIAADNARADALGLVFHSDPRYDRPTSETTTAADSEPPRSPDPSSAESER